MVGMYEKSANFQYSKYLRTNSTKAYVGKTTELP